MTLVAEPNHQHRFRDRRPDRPEHDQQHRQRTNRRAKQPWCTIIGTPGPDTLSGDNGADVHMHEPKTAVDHATDEEIVALFAACRPARDRLIVLLLSRAGLRRTAARSCPVDTSLPTSSSPSSKTCEQAGNYPDGSGAPVLLPQRICRALRITSGSRQFVLVNLFKEPVGRATPPRAINELLERLSVRAGLDRIIHPHLLRHAFGSSVMEAGATLDEAQELLRHASVTSTQVYLHPSPDRLREAVERVSVGRPVGPGAGR